MNDQETKITKKLLDEIEGAKDPSTKLDAIRRHGEFVRSVAIRTDAQTRHNESVERIKLGRL